MTLRQLLWMAEGLGRARWTHTATLCTLIANAHRDPRKTRPYRPSDFNPYATADRRSRKVADTEDLALLREAFEARAPRPLPPQPKGY